MRLLFQNSFLPPLEKEGSISSSHSGKPGSAPGGRTHGSVGPLALTLRLIHSEPPVAHPAAQASSSGSASHRLLLWEVVILCIHQLISPVLGAAVCPVTSLLSNLRELVGFQLVKQEVSA